MHFTQAHPQESTQLANFINAAYRGETSRLGWTTEADLLDGLRTSAEEIESLIKTENSKILTCKAETQLRGSVHLQYTGQQAQLGMLAVDPLYQAQGIGRQLLQYAEQIAQQTWHAQLITMSVIPCRAELIAYYERRGYRRTGISKAFPVNPALWTPKVAGLSLEVLEKHF